MKILHTADWHIGKRLYQKELHEDFSLFIDWLCQTIKDQQVDVLLVSGDVFDLANPSAEARQLYYSALHKLSKLNIQIVLTGGNHDSPAMLNAPCELLMALNITVIGELPANREELIIPLGSRSEPEAVVAAIPFIRDNELRKLAPGQSYEERQEAITEGIREIFNESAELIQKHYPSATPLAMGHLFAHGASTSSSEREIQVGNLAGFESNQFPKEFKYIALGHIHKPQRAGSDHILYSGSPVPLSFDEKNHDKRVIIIDLNEEKLNPVSVPVPSWRELKRVKGNLTEIKDELSGFSGSDKLPAFLEIELVEEHRNPAEIMELETLVEQFNEAKNNAEILKYFITITGESITSSGLFQNQKIEELKPSEVFSKWIEKSEVDEETGKLMNEAFEDILQEYHQNEKL